MLYPRFLRKIYNPPEFQGNLKKRNYFEGWYLKHVNADLIHSISFIPGVSLSEDPHCFIQILNGLTGESFYIRYELKDFSSEPGRFAVRIGESFFSDKFSEINIRKEKINVSGRIEYRNTLPYPGTLTNPGIMGWYSFVPFMECKHGVVSMNHTLSGNIKLNGQMIDFNGGKGYIEKDWGTSFPESWIWVQCNHFKTENVSFMLSIAKIPWINKHFTGFLGFLHTPDKIYRFATYNQSRINHLDKNGNNIEVQIMNKDFNLRVSIHMNQFSDLKAPRLGLMDRYMKESVDSDIELELKDHKKGTRMLNLDGTRAGLEITGDVALLSKSLYSDSDPIQFR
jgi:hypothetical protein